MAITFQRLRHCLLSICLLSGLAMPANAQTGKPAAPADQQNLIEVLIQEVRQLRLTMERNGVTVFRAQIAVERLRAQQEVVNRLGRELDQTREQASAMKIEMSQYSEAVQEAEKKVDAGLISNEQLREIKSQIEVMKQREQTIRDRETSLANQLNTENGKLYALNQRLDMLEQVLESIQNLEPPKKPKKTN